MKRRLAAAIAVMLGTSTVLVASPAHAEGSWSSYFEKVMPGFETRHFDDRNSDNIHSVLTIKNCRFWDGSRYVGANNGVIMEFYKEIDFWPDSSLGQKTFYCLSSASQGWGDPASGRYYWSVVKGVPYYDLATTANPVSATY